jgi:hypothetical protein
MLIANLWLAKPQDDRLPREGTRSCMAGDAAYY